MLAIDSTHAELLRKLSVLFVDDDSEVRENMAHYLSRRVGKVHTAPNGEAGLSTFREMQPDLVISDIRMGGMDGLAMCKAIREIDANLPVIFISAHNESEILLSSIDLGVTKFIVKPVDTDVLMGTISGVALALNRRHVLENQLHQRGEESFESESVINYVCRVLDADRHEEFSNIRHLSIPKRGVSGDFYSVVKYGGDLYVMLADGAGHGLAAVIPALPLPAIFRKHAERGFSLLSIAADLNRTLFEQHAADHFVAATLMRYCPRDGFIEMLNCGNPPACVFSGEGSLLHMARSRSTALGLAGSHEFSPEVERFKVDRDSRIYLFTDGLVDTLQPGAPSDDSAIHAVFAHEPSADVFPVIVGRVGDALREGAADDITLLEIQCGDEEVMPAEMARSAPAEPPPDTEKAVSLDQLAVLYVEDDELTREYLSAYLNRRMGMVHVARNGEEGLSMFAKYRPQIVLADIKMPVMDGLVMAEEIRKLDRDVPIIVTSGSDSIGDAEKMFEMGISRFHLKPLDPGKLISTIQTCVQQAHALAQLRYFALAFQASSLAVITADRDKRIIAVNPSFSRITGYAVAEVMGHNPMLLSSGKHDASYFNAMWHALETFGSWSGELVCQHKDGQTVSDWLTANLVRGESGQLMGYNFIFSDISERRQTEERVIQLTMHDGLTRLPNRAMFEKRLSEQLAQTSQVERRLAVVYINLDRFIEINNTLGVRAGDEVLFAVAQRLLTGTDGVDMVCRMGGDEFAVLMLCEGGRPTIERATVELLQRIKQPLHIGGHDIQLRASVGISLYPSDGETYEELLKSASTAMNQSRQAGGDTYSFFDRMVGRLEERRAILRQEIKAGLSNNEFYMLYQPKYSLGRQCVVGAEALVRWLHPVYGVISPAEFIPLAESSGAVIEMSEWIIDTVCSQMAEWRQHGLAQVPVSINISPVHFWRGDLVGSLQKGLQKWDLPAAMLPIEVTEGLVMDTSEKTLHVLAQLKELGFHISIDDFGTGYSSLKYLKDLPVSELKIDRSFVVEIPEAGQMLDRSRTAIPRAIIQLASEFNLGVVAEGVETESQKNFLLENGCDVIQGYLFHQPLTAQEFASLL